ncbi:ULP1B [Symbiodinium sp. CCMP2592]|nr:ULP1B [Symbiodinium sp. CCMP2592]
MATANGGRLMLNFGGIYYTHDKNGHPVGHRFSAIRSFDVCEKSWTIEGDLGMDTFALQTAASQKLQIAVTCGGESVERFLNRNGNQPWCIVHRPRHDLVLANRHGVAATHGFPSGFVPGKVQVTGKSTILVPVPTTTTMTTTAMTTTTTTTTTTTATTTTTTTTTTATTEDAGDNDEDDVGKLPSSATAGTVSAVLGLAATQLLPTLMG